MELLRNGNPALSSSEWPVVEFVQGFALLLPNHEM
jgi:hypothetical protein